MNLNGEVGKAIENHLENDTSIQTERQVTLDNQPFQQGDQFVPLVYGVGGNLWTTFPTYFDVEFDGTGELAAPFTLVSFAYELEESQLPEVHKFFRV